MASIPRAESFPMKCPSCNASAGFPFKATTSPDGSAIELAVRCHSCRKEWVAVMVRTEQLHGDMHLVRARR